VAEITEILVPNRWRGLTEARCTPTGRARDTAAEATPADTGNQFVPFWAIPRHGECGAPAAGFLHPRQYRRGMPIRGHRLAR